MNRRAIFVFLGSVVMVAIAPAGFTAARVKSPAIDPKRIINESYGFLKEREPQMTENEYVIYEKIVPMAKENPELVLQMLEGMVGGAEPPSPAFSYVLGNAYFSLDQIGPAETHFLKAVGRHPDFLRAWSNLGILYYGANRFEEAVRCLSRAVELGERDGRTLATLGYCHYRAGNLLSAELAYMQAVTVAPDDTNSIAALAGLLIENREYARAEPLARRLLRLKPEEKSHWSLYADLLASTGRRTEATATLELAASLGLADAGALLNLGDLYADAGNHSDAEAAYRKLEAAAPGEGAMRLLSRVRANLQEGRSDEAVLALEKIPVPAGSELRIAYLRTVAEVRRARREWPATIGALEELLRLKPLDADALLALGRAAGQAGDLSRAELAFADAVRQPAVAYPANLELANLALRSRRYKEVVAYLEAALAIDRNPVLLRQLAQIKTYLPDHE